MKQLKITNLAEVEGAEMLAFTFVLFEDGKEKISGGNSIDKPATEEERNIALRKLCDNDIEIFIDETSIGFGALNFGNGMTAEELEAKAKTPERD